MTFSGHQSHLQKDLGTISKAPSHPRISWRFVPTQRSWDRNEPSHPGADAPGEDMELSTEWNTVEYIYQVPWMVWERDTWGNSLSRNIQTKRNFFFFRIVKNDPPKWCIPISHCPRNGKLYIMDTEENQKWPLKNNQTELTIIWLGKVWDTVPNSSQSDDP